MTPHLHSLSYAHFMEYQTGFSTVFHMTRVNPEVKQNTKQAEFFYPSFCLFTVSVYSYMLCCKHCVFLYILCYWNTQVLQRHNLVVFAVWLRIPTLYFLSSYIYSYHVTYYIIPHRLRASCIAEVWSCLEKQYHLHQISPDPVYN